MQGLGKVIGSILLGFIIGIVGTIKYLEEEDLNYVDIETLKQNRDKYRKGAFLK